MADTCKELNQYSLNQCQRLAEPRGAEEQDMGIAQGDGEQQGGGEQYLTEHVEAFNKLAMLQGCLMTLSILERERASTPGRHDTLDVGYT